MNTMGIKKCAVFLVFNLFSIINGQINCNINMSKLDLTYEDYAVLNNNLIIQLEKFGGCLNDSEIKKIINNLKTRTWNYTQAEIAIELYSSNHKNWFFKHDSTNNHIPPTFKNVHDYEMKKDSLISSNLGIGKNSNIISDTPSSIIFKEAKLPWKLYKKNTDSINFYSNKKDWESLKKYINKIKKSRKK